MPSPVQKSVWAKAQLSLLRPEFYHCGLRGCEPPVSIETGSEQNVFQISTDKCPSQLRRGPEACFWEVSRGQLMNQGAIGRLDHLLIRRISTEKCPFTGAPGHPGVSGLWGSQPDCEKAG